MVAALSRRRPAAATDTRPAATGVAAAVAPRTPPTVPTVRSLLRPVPRRERALQLPLIPEDELPAGAAEDLVPEQTQYRDEGCEVWHACLSCPFSRCLLEIPGGPRRLLRVFRHAEARRMFDAGVPIDEIAAELGISRRTVYHALGGVRRRQRAAQEPDTRAAERRPRTRRAAGADRKPASAPTRLKGARS